jgi:hypothetical protein
VTATGDFQVGANNCTGTTLANGGSCTVGVTFRPSGSGSRTGALTVNSSSTPASITVQLQGNGVVGQGVLSVAPQSLTFTKNCRREESSAAAQSVVVSNRGTGPLSGLTVGPLPISGFQVNNNCRSELAAGASCSVSARFTGRVTASGTFNVSATGATPQSVTLFGTCTSQASP